MGAARIAETLPTTCSSIPACPGCLRQILYADEADDPFGVVHHDKQEWPVWMGQSTAFPQRSLDGSDPPADGDMGAHTEMGVVYR